MHEANARAGVVFVGCAMKIVIGTNGLAYGGAEAAVVTLGNELARRDHCVAVWILLRDAALDRIEELDQRISVVRFTFESFQSLRANLEFRRAIRTTRPDAALYVGNPVAAGIHALSSPATPVFYWVQNYVRPRRGRLLELAAYVAGTRIVALNRSVAATVLGRCRLVVPNSMPARPGVEMPDEDPPAWRNGRLLIVGRIVPQKDHRFLLDVMALLSGRPEEFELDVVGGGGILEEVKAIASENGLDRVVHFHGKAASAPWFEQCPMYVMSSRWEGHGVVLMEAAAHGCPIIARDAPGVRDTLGEGYEGLTPHESPQAMASTIVKWFAEPDATSKRAKSLQERMYREYSLTKITDAWERLFRSAPQRW